MTPPRILPPLALALPALLAPPLLPARAGAADFWQAWGDGKAELDGYRLTQPRYGQQRDATAVLIFVTEDMSDSLRVKADPGKHEPRDVYPVLKLNAVRKFQTGIYDYSVMTSVFSRVDWGQGERPFPLRKISFSSQEWCGHVYHQILPRGGALVSHSHSYFDGEADAEVSLEQKKDGLSEDELPILLRTYPGRADLLQPGEHREVPFLPALLRVRLLHRPLGWGTATFTRKPGTETVKTPAGSFAVVTYTVAAQTPAGQDTATYHIEAQAPHRLVHWRWESGEEGTLAGSARLPYWQLHDKGQESYLKQIGLSPRRP